MITTASVTLNYLVCGTCGCPFMLPAMLYETAKSEGGYFYCPNGHKRGWTEYTGAKLLKEEVEQITEKYYRAEKRITEHMAYARRLERQLAAQKAATTRAKNKGKK